MNVHDVVSSRSDSHVFPRQLDQIARDHTHTLMSQALRHPGETPWRPGRRAIRRRTGWTLVMIGLRIAETAGR
jgi:hypothetical protein